MRAPTLTRPPTVRFCGVNRHDDGLKTDRAEMMLDIYETAKTAFAGDGPS